MENLQEENDILKQRIEYLEAILELNNETIQKAIETNNKLLNYIKSNLPK